MSAYTRSAAMRSDEPSARRMTTAPGSMAVIKAQLWKVPFQDFATALALADDEMQKSFKSEDFREGVAAVLEKRPAKFTGR